MEKKKPNRKRPFPISVYLNIDELTAIEENMGRAGIENREFYARKMLTDGYIINPINTQAQLKEIARLMRMASHNINQVAKRANETQSVYEYDLKQLQEEVKSLYAMVADTRKSVTGVLKL